MGVRRRRTILLPPWPCLKVQAGPLCGRRKLPRSCPSHRAQMGRHQLKRIRARQVLDPSLNLWRTLVSSCHICKIGLPYGGCAVAYAALLREAVLVCPGVSVTRLRPGVQCGDAPGR